MGVLAEDITVVFEEGHGKKKKPASDEENCSDEENGGGKKAYDNALATYNNDMHSYKDAREPFKPIGPLDERGAPKKPNPADYGLSENEEAEESTAHGPRPKLNGVPVYR